MGAKMLLIREYGLQGLGAWQLTLGFTRILAFNKDFYNTKSVKIFNQESLGSSQFKAFKLANKWKFNIKSTVFGVSS
ncbi:hypothetical protein [Bacillus sp. OK048]|uniref:hypothetical protein n=1 Tax=Bacillus sp. OK048 TaxID=1882761 RepID=UPI0011134F20|nr:hypothetical protein [Bacillus sp. OK048]